MAEITPSPRSGNTLSYFLSWFTPVKPHALKIIGFAATCIASYVAFRESNNLKIGTGIFFVGSALSLTLPSTYEEDSLLSEEATATAEKTHQTIVSPRQNETTSNGVQDTPNTPNSGQIPTLYMIPDPNVAQTLPENHSPIQTNPISTLEPAEVQNHSFVIDQIVSAQDSTPEPDSKETTSNGVQDSPSTPKPQIVTTSTPSSQTQTLGTITEAPAIAKTPPENHSPIQTKPNSTLEPLEQTSILESIPTTLPLLPTKQEETLQTPTENQSQSSNSKLIPLRSRRTDSSKKTKQPVQRKLFHNETPPVLQSQFRELSPYKSPAGFENDEMQEIEENFSQSTNEGMPTPQLPYNQVPHFQLSEPSSKATTPFQSPDGYHSSSNCDSEGGSWGDSPYASPYSSPNGKN